MHCCSPASIACTSPLIDEKLNGHYSTTPLLFGDFIMVLELSLRYSTAHAIRGESEFSCVLLLLRVAFIVHIVTLYAECVFESFPFVHHQTTTQQKIPILHSLTHSFGFICNTLIHICMLAARQYGFDSTTI